MSGVAATDFWQRAVTTLDSARLLAGRDDDSSASRAYYAAFYAVSAVFALQDRSFSKHTALEAAVHRDLVRPGLWPEELGREYSVLVALRATGDYGGGSHVSGEDAAKAVAAAGRILRQASLAHPTLFPLPV